MTSRYPLWEGKEVDHESARINAQEGKTPADLGIVMPYSTIKPLLVALGTGAMAAGAVVIYFSRLGTPMLTHERVTLSAVAKAIAQIKDYEFADCYDNPANYSGTVFFVPDDTLMPDEASCLGVGCPNDLFGGVVPYPIAKTKAITHQLVDHGADHPQGWSSMFAEKVRDVVLPGYTAFSARDAQMAAMSLQPEGATSSSVTKAAGMTCTSSTSMVPKPVG